MKELLSLLQEVNGIIRDERDSSVKSSKEMLTKLEALSFRCEGNRRRLDMLRHKLNRPV